MTWWHLFWVWQERLAISPLIDLLDGRNEKYRNMGLVIIGSLDLGKYSWTALARKHWDERY